MDEQQLSWPLISSIAVFQFADAVKKSDNYYVIATREPLYNLP